MMFNQILTYAQNAILGVMIAGVLVLGFCTNTPMPAFGYATASLEEQFESMRPKGDLYSPIEEAPDLDDILGPIIKYLPDGSSFHIMRQPQLLKPDNPITRCTGNVLYEKAWILAIRLMPDGTAHVYIDTNKDGKRDIVATFFPKNESDYADKYLVDLDYDGAYDAIYLDEGHTGKCDNIKPQGGEQPETPITPGPNYDSSPEAEI